MAHHLYDENKRLKAENAALREQLAQKKQLDNEDNMDALAREAFKQILTGKASLVTTDGNREGERVTYLQMLPVPAPDAGGDLQ